jgi:hypothetical protein
MNWKKMNLVMHLVSGGTKVTHAIDEQAAALNGAVNNKQRSIILQRTIMSIAPLVGIATDTAAPAQTAADFQFSAGVITGYTGSEKAVRIPAVLEGAHGYGYRGGLGGA